MFEADNYIYFWEWIALPFYLLFILLVANAHQRRKINEAPIYKYYQRGLAFKLLGGIVFAVIYNDYYGYGDTFGYFLSADAMKNLMLHSLPAWAKNEFGGASIENYNLFTPRTGFPLIEEYNDPRIFMAIRIYTPIMLFSFGKYLLSTVIVSWLSYIGLWKLFLVFASYYPQYKKYLFIAILCVPSVIFWGSGIMKDTITLSFTGWVVYCVYNIFILKKNILGYSILSVLFLFAILIIRPYTVFALLPGTFIWILSHRIYQIRNGLVRILIIPFIIIICLSGGYLIIKNLGDYMGKFSIEQISKTAQITESDLKQDYYGGHSFDIGNFEPTPAGYLKVFPKAFVAGAYRPFIWESGNIVMIMSSLENTFLLFLTLLIFIRNSPYNILKRLFKEPLLFFSFSYSVFFAFAVGLTTANFGALVRFKIAYLPFFVACLYILSRKEKKAEYVIEDNNE